MNIEIGTKLKDAERMLIEQTLQHCAGKKAEAAKLLGISMKTLYNKVKLYAHVAN